MISVESGGDTNAVSPKGAVGLMQIMPHVAASPGLGLKGIDPKTLKNPGVNVTFGRSLVEALLKRYDDDLDKVLAAYNWGIGNVDRAVRRHGDPHYLQHLPHETRHYIRKVRLLIRSSP